MARMVFGNPASDFAPTRGKSHLSATGRRNSTGPALCGVHVKGRGEADLVTRLDLVTCPNCRAKIAKSIADT